MSEESISSDDEGIPKAAEQEPASSPEQEPAPDHGEYTPEVEIATDGDGGVLVDVAPVDTNVAAASGDRPGRAADITLYEVDEPGDPVSPLVVSPTDSA